MCGYINFFYLIAINLMFQYYFFKIRKRRYIYIVYRKLKTENEF